MSTSVSSLVDNLSEIYEKECKGCKKAKSFQMYASMSILDISKTLMLEFWYDCIKPKYQDKAKLCYMNTGSFVIHIKTEDFYEDIANDVEELFDTSNYDNTRPLPIGKNKKVIGLFIDELGGKITKEFFAFKAKTYV